MYIVGLGFEEPVSTKYSMEYRPAIYIVHLLVIVSIEQTVCDCANNALMLAYRCQLMFSVD